MDNAFLIMQYIKIFLKYNIGSYRDCKSQPPSQKINPDTVVTVVWTQYFHPGRTLEAISETENIYTELTERMKSLEKISEIHLETYIEVRLKTAVRTLCRANLILPFDLKPWDYNFA